jgi:putative lipoprotein (rSAM/lipoprotein system)
MTGRIYRLMATVLGAVVGTGCTTESGGGGAGGTAGTGGTGPVGGAGGTGMVSEYGMPFAHFVVDGTVKAAGTQTPIAGIEVAFEGVYTTTQTAADGTWSIDADGEGLCMPNCEVTATDTDGAGNGGTFETTTVQVTLTNTVPGSGTWDEGTWAAQDVAIDMAAAAGGGGGAAGAGGGGGTGTAGAGGGGGSG